MIDLTNPTNKTTWAKIGFDTNVAINFASLKDVRLLN